MGRGGGGGRKGKIGRSLFFAIPGRKADTTSLPASHSSLASLSCPPVANRECLTQVVLEINLHVIGKSIKYK